MSKVNIKNVSNCSVSLYVPECNVQRLLLPRQGFNVERETYDELILNQGVEALFKEHYLVVSGLEENDTPITDTKVVTAEEIAKMFDTQNITEFAKFIPTAAPAEKDAAVELAVEKKITNSGFTSLIKKYCGRDVMELINMKHQEEI